MGLVTHGGFLKVSKLFCDWLDVTYHIHIRSGFCILCFPSLNYCFLFSCTVFQKVAEMRGEGTGKLSNILAPLIRCYWAGRYEVVWVIKRRKQMLTMAPNKKKFDGPSNTATPTTIRAKAVEGHVGALDSIV